jgi:hypothetical protein
VHREAVEPQALLVEPVFAQRPVVLAEAQPRRDAAAGQSDPANVTAAAAVHRPQRVGKAGQGLLGAGVAAFQPLLQGSAAHVLDQGDLGRVDGQGAQM